MELQRVGTDWREIEVAAIAGYYCHAKRSVIWDIIFAI